MDTSLIILLGFLVGGTVSTFWIVPEAMREVRDFPVDQNAALMGSIIITFFGWPVVMPMYAYKTIRLAWSRVKFERELVDIQRGSAARQREIEAAHEHGFLCMHCGYFLIVDDYHVESCDRCQSPKVVFMTRAFLGAEKIWVQPWYLGGEGAYVIRCEPLDTNYENGDVVRCVVEGDSPWLIVKEKIPHLRLVPPPEPPDAA